MSENRSLTPLFLLIALSLIWGTSFILIKQGLKVFSADEVGALRFLLRLYFLFPLAIPRIKQLQPEHFFRLFLSGLMGTFFPAFLFATAQTRLSSSVAGILNTLSPVGTIVVGALFFHQRFRAIAIVGLVVSLGGTLLLALSRSGGSDRIQPLCAVDRAGVRAVQHQPQLGKIPYTGIATLTITGVALSLIGPLGMVYLSDLQDLPTNSSTWKDMARLWFYRVPRHDVDRYRDAPLQQITQGIDTVVCELCDLPDAHRIGNVGRSRWRTIASGHFLGMAAILATLPGQSEVDGFFFSFRYNPFQYENQPDCFDRSCRMFRRM